MHDEEPDHGDGRPASCFVSADGPGLLVPREDDGDDHVTGAHPNRSGVHDGFAAELVDVEDRGDGGEEHGDADDTGGEEGGCVTACAQSHEDGGGVIQDCIYTCELLEEHRHRRDDDAAKHGFRGEQGTDGYELQLECVHRSQSDQMRPFLRCKPLLKYALGFDLQELELDKGMVLL